MDNIKFEIVDKEPEPEPEADKQVNVKTVFMNQTIEEKIQNYIKTNNPKLYILTPCYGSMCHVNYIICLMNTINLFKQIGFPLQIEFCKNDSLVSRARNNLIARAMNDPTSTHFMFIDSDISWDPLDILKLILSEKELIGGIYPLKHYEWSKLSSNPEYISQLLKRKNESELSKVINDEQMIQHNLLKYNVNYLTNMLEIDNNLAKVRHVATGFMMIKREVIKKMMKSFPSTKYVDDINFLKPQENEFAYALFDCGVEEGHYFSEDWLFCHRWTKMGNEIWIDVSINLVHSGVEDYCGSYISSII
jgi:acyl-CoA synthetase (AMP-forming)/AMP-acid ligase II